MKLKKIEIEALDHGYFAKAIYDDGSMKAASADTPSILLRRVAEFCGRTTDIANTRDLVSRGRGKPRNTGDKDGQND